MGNDNGLKIPTVHLNGSGFKLLTEQYEVATRAVGAALDALPVPHGRDYYVQEDGAYEVARKQFHDQHAKLTEVLTELRTIYREIHRQERGMA